MARDNAVLVTFEEILENEELLEKYSKMTAEELHICEAQLLPNEARDLDLLIKAETVDDFKIEKADPKLVHEMICEALHQGLSDAWTPDQEVAIRAFLADIAMGVSECQ